MAKKKTAKKSPKKATTTGTKKKAAKRTKSEDPIQMAARIFSSLEGQDGGRRGTLGKGR